MIEQFDSLEQMLSAIQRRSEAAAEGITPAQREMLDGREHFFLFIDGFAIRDFNLCVGRIRTQEEIDEEIPSYYDENDEDIEALVESDRQQDRHMRALGYPKVQWWDGYYETEGAGDYHDVHVTRMLEITESEFNAIRALKQDIKAVAKDPQLAPLLSRWITEVYIENPWTN